MNNIYKRFLVILFIAIAIPIVDNVLLANSTEKCTNIQKIQWEYLELRPNRWGKFDYNRKEYSRYEIFNIVGKDGWELVDFEGLNSSFEVYIFKRSKLWQE